MLYEFLIANREELIRRYREKVAERIAPRPLEPELDDGIAKFLDQFTLILRQDAKRNAAGQGKISAPAVPRDPGSSSEIDLTAVSHGSELLRQGFTVDQVVYDYGDLCQAVTGLAIEQNESITPAEFRLLNMCLDSATASAVVEYGHQRDRLIAAQEAAAANKRLGFLAHELRNLLSTALLAVSVIKSGNVGLTGATGAVLDRSLLGLRNLIDLSLADVRLTAGLAASRKRISISEFIEEVKVSAALEAQARGVSLSVWPVEEGLWVQADPHILSSAIANLLQNAFKFTKARGCVSLSVRTTNDHVRIEVADQCGGLPPGKAEELFDPFEQRGADRTGLGLGLSITLRGIEAMGGTVKVRNLPGTGCVFTVELRLEQPLRSVA